MMRKITALSVLVFFALATPQLWAAWVNETAPDFTLPDMNGNQVSFDTLKGKVVFINFWASWCHPCKKEFPELNKLAEKYKGEQFVVLAVNIDKRRKNADEFLERFRPVSQNMVILFDPESSVVASYAARAMPSSFLIDKTGVIRYVHLGFWEKNTDSWVSETESLLKSGD
jgi:thiol-disulfide isomerase/thioredoxin